MESGDIPALFVDFGGAALGGAAFWRAGRVLGYTRHLERDAIPGGS
jgi:hypothetical protein